MSIEYDMGISIRDYNSEKEENIIAAWRNEWHPDAEVSSALLKDDDGDDRLTIFPSNGFLIGGESEEEFCERVSKAIWKANGGYCPLEVTCIYLENPPVETHLMNKEVYESIMKE